MKQKLRQSTLIKLAFIYVTGCSVLLILLLTIWFSIDYSKKVAARHKTSTFVTGPEVTSSARPVSQTIELLYFNAKRNTESVIITWSTASEKYNRYFTIERSIDGKKFIKLAKVRSHGNGSIIREYLYSDVENLLTKTYYRLTQTDLLDKEYDLRTIAIYNKVKPTSITSVSPNPSSD